MPEAKIYDPHERPDIEVLVDGTWHQGELRAWFPADDGTWSANVTYRTAPGENRILTVPEDHVRPESQPDVRRRQRPS